MAASNKLLGLFILFLSCQFLLNHSSQSQQVVKAEEEYIEEEAGIFDSVHSSVHTLIKEFMAATSIEEKKVILPKIEHQVSKIKLNPTGRYQCMRSAILFLRVAKNCLENGQIDPVPDDYKLIVPVEEDGFTLKNSEIHRMFPLDVMQNTILDCTLYHVQHAKHT